MTDFGSVYVNIPIWLLFKINETSIFLMYVQIKQLCFTICWGTGLELFTFLGCQHRGLCVSLQSQEDSEFKRTQEEVVQFNRQISKLSQAGHLWFLFPICPALVKLCAPPHRRMSCCARPCWKPRLTSPSSTRSWTNWRTCTLIKEHNTKGDAPVAHTHRQWWSMWYRVMCFFIERGLIWRGWWRNTRHIPVRSSFFSRSLFFTRPCLFACSVSEVYCISSLIIALFDTLL